MNNSDTKSSYFDKKSVRISDVEIPIIEYNGERVVTFKMIDAVHQRPEGTASRNFRANRQRFTESKHYFHVLYQDAIMNDEFRRSGIEANPKSGLILITERGYLLLVKSFNDDLAWQVQDELVEIYFRVKDLFNQPSNIDMIIRTAMEMKRLEQKQGKSDIKLDRVIQRQIDSDLKIEKIKKMQTETGVGLKNLTNLYSELDHRITAVESETEADSGKTRYQTIRSYCNTHGLKISRSQAAARGRQASRLSKNMGIPINKSKDELFGKVNTYHEDVLKKVFDDLLSAESKQDLLF